MPKETTTLMRSLSNFFESQTSTNTSDKQTLRCYFFPASSLSFQILFTSQGIAEDKHKARGKQGFSRTQIIPSLWLSADTSEAGLSSRECLHPPVPPQPCVSSAQQLSRESALQRACDFGFSPSSNDVLGP